MLIKFCFKTRKQKFYKFYNYVMYYMKIKVIYELNMTKLYWIGKLTYFKKIYILNKLSLITRMSYN